MIVVVEHSTSSKVWSVVQYSLAKNNKHMAQKFSDKFANF